MKAMNKAVIFWDNCYKVNTDQLQAEAGAGLHNSSPARVDWNDMETALNSETLSKEEFEVWEAEADCGTFGAYNGVLYVKLQVDGRPELVEVTDEEPLTDDEINLINHNLPIHQDEESDSPIIGLVGYNDFDREVRDLLHSGAMYGAHLNRDGNVVVVDLWGKHYPTNVRVNQ